MGMLSPILRNAKDAEGNSYLTFWCPGCKCAHQVAVNRTDNTGWKWNGNAVKPTWTPSLLVRCGHYAPGHEGPGCWCIWNKEHPEEAIEGWTCQICHSFTTDGQIQFLGDCTHELANKTVPIPEWPLGHSDWD